LNTQLLKYNSFLSGFEFPRDIFLEEDERLAEASSAPIDIIKLLKEEISSSLLSGNVSTSYTGRYSVKIGISALDELLGQGFPSNVLTEVYGAAGSGKTHLCLQLAANILKSSSNTKILFICTQERFSIDRLVCFLDDDDDDDHNSYLDRVHIEYFLEPEVELHFFSYVIHHLMQEFNYGLIIYDGVACNTRNIENVFQKAEHLYNIVSSFRRIFLLHRVCVVFTNQVTDIPNESDSESLKASALGLTLENSVNIKIQIEHNKRSNERSFVLKKSLFTPLLAARFVITSENVKGIVNNNDT